MAVLELQAALNAYTRELFNTARANLEQGFRESVQVPEDTGQLKDSYSEPNVNDFGERKSVIVEIKALSDEGTDYGQILQDLPRITPTQAKALRWVSNGAVIFSQGFDNKWHQWWTDWLATDPWTDALQDATTTTEWPT